jgi:hypothetical protein
VLFINVVNSSIVILLKGHTVGVVHVGVPKDYIYLNHLCLSYIGNILSHHNILSQLKPMLNIVTIPFNTGGTKWCSCLRNSATSRTVAGSIPDGVIGIFH